MIICDWKQKELKIICKNNEKLCFFVKNGGEKLTGRNDTDYFNSRHNNLSKFEIRPSSFVHHITLQKLIRYGHMNIASFAREEKDSV